MLQSDALRSAIFILLGAGVIWALVEEKIKVSNGLLILGILIVVDMWGVDKRYLNDALFVSAQEARNPIKATAADQAILQDKTSDYRVLNMAVSTFNDATTSYFHQSIGGYHGAKMRRYQELIDFHIGNEMALIGQRLEKIKTESGMDSLFLGLNALNILNTKYLIYNPQAVPIQNKHALGSVWLVDKYQFVDNADQEIAAIKIIDPAREVVIDKKYQAMLNGVILRSDPEANIVLKEKSLNKMTYHYQGNGNQLAVFSAIYYPKGWNVYIEGKIVPHFQADFLLRSMLLTKGNYDIVFKFEPVSFLVGSVISFWSSILLLLFITALFVKTYFLPAKN